MKTTDLRISFEEFYQAMGLKSYPFHDRTAEKEDTAELFINPIDYSRLQNVVSSNQTVIICGNRGSGKTITLCDLKSKTESGRLICSIDNFEEVKLENNQLDYYSLILKNLTRNLLVYLAEHKIILKKATKDEKIFLSFLIKKYGSSITDSQLRSQLENIQLNWLQKFTNKISMLLTATINYGATAITNFGSELLTKHFGSYLPDINSTTVKSIFPEIRFAVENQFSSVDISYSMLEMSLRMIKTLTGNAPMVFFDKLDEDIRLENDAELVAKFVKDLLCDNKLLHNDDIQLLISVWKIPFTILGPVFRVSKHTVYSIDWNFNQLMLVLNNRLSVYSDNKIDNYRNLFAKDVTEEDFESIFTLSNYNPRDLWSIFDALFSAQYSLNCSAKQITHAAVSEGLYNFVSTFQFYEYYPRKKNAQRNTNDVYSYINYLLKLKGTDEFTHEELRNKASTGGSTTNYITGMMAIGLVRKTDKKRPGGAVIYKISDPKVTYAIFNGIEIQHV